ncbi:MAG: aminotransferase class V-fold PLP-dependent enzyme [Myxococcaceae bacterium]|nr:aminotransferase class V-fold PLP-dependent enzyme [Myxococcaceae bacterium]
MWTLDPTIAFLNHGSFGACPRPVQDAQARWRERMEAEPVRFFVRELDAALDAVRERLGAFLGARGDDLAFVPNATTGVNAVVQRWALKAGDEVVVTTHGYNACTNAVRFVCDRAGATVRFAERRFAIAAPDEVVDAARAVLTERTRYALIDHVTSPTGLVFPVAELIALFQGRGVEVLVDGAHAPGMLPLQLEALGASWYAGNLHKWVCAPKGSAFLWVRKDRQAALRPLVISHGANSPRTDRSRFRLEHDWVGTDDPSPFLCVSDALDTLERLLPGGLPALQARNHALALDAQRLLCRALGIAPPAPPSMLGSMASLPLPRRTGGPTAGFSDVGDPVQEALFHRHRIEVPIFPFAGGRLMRVCAQHYNRLEEYERLAGLLPGLLATAPTF